MPCRPGRLIRHGSGVSLTDVHVAEAEVLEFLELRREPAAASRGASAAACAAELASTSSAHMLKHGGLTPDGKCLSLLKKG